MRSTLIYFVLGLIGFSNFWRVKGGWSEFFNRWSEYQLEYDTLAVSGDNNFILVPVTRPIKENGKDAPMGEYGIARLYPIAPGCYIACDTVSTLLNPRFQSMADSIYKTEHYVTISQKCKTLVYEWIGYRDGLYFREIYFRNPMVTVGYYGFPIAQMARIDSCINTIRVLSLPDSLRRHRNTK